MRVHDSQAYRKMDVTREHISRILELREVLLSFQTSFSLVSAAAVCAVLESISGLKPSSEESAHKVNSGEENSPTTLARIKTHNLSIISLALVLTDGLQDH